MCLQTQFPVSGSQFSVRSDEANAGGDLVSSSGKQAQHAHGIGFVARLAENLAIDHDDGVGAQNELAGLLTERSLGFLSRQAFRAVARALSRPR